METNDLIQYLTDAGFNVFPDANFIPADIQESQLPALFVFGTGGYSSDETLDISQPTFQILIKGKNYNQNSRQMGGTERLAIGLIELFDKKHNYQVGPSYVYVSKALQSSPIPLGLDEKRRPTFSTNFYFKARKA